MPKDTPKMAGTMIKTRRRVNHTVKEMPSNMQIRLSKGTRKEAILQDQVSHTPTECQEKTRMTKMVISPPEPLTTSWPLAPLLRET